MKRLMTKLLLLSLVFCTNISAYADSAETEWAKLNNEIASLTQQGNLDRAIVLAKQALQVAEKSFGPNHTDVALSLHNLAKLYYTQGQYAQAEPLYKRALAIQEKTLGTDHPIVASNLKNLAVLYKKTGREKEAMELEERAAVIQAIKQ